MRVKTQEKRQAILQVAAEAFRELGYEGTSMCEIRDRVGGSKATLYSYFPSKEDLFFEVIFSSIEMDFEISHSYLEPATTDLVETLTTFGLVLLRSLYTPQAIAVRRLIFAESRRSDLGRICYERGVKQSHQRLSKFLQATMACGKLREADPDVVAWHLYGLLEAELFRRYLLCVDEAATDAEIQGCVKRAVVVFIAAYGNSA